MAEVEASAGASAAAMLSACAYGPMNGACFVAPAWTAPAPQPPATADTTSCTLAADTATATDATATDATAIDASSSMRRTHHPQSWADGLSLFARQEISAGNAIGEWHGPLVPVASLRSACGVVLPPRSARGGAATHFIDGALRHRVPASERQRVRASERLADGSSSSIRWPATYALPARRSFNASLVWRPAVEEAGELRMWLVAEETIPRGAEIRFDARSANLPSSAVGACSELSMMEAAETAAEEMAEEEGGKGLPMWRRRRQPAGLTPPALGPDALARLDALCFGSREAEDDDDEEDEEEDEEEEQAPVDGNGYRAAAEPPPLYA